MNTPYATPIANSDPSVGTGQIYNKRILAVLGCVLLSGPLFGALGTVMGMIGAFSTLAAGDGSPDVSGLAGNISMALLTTLYGVAFGGGGVVLVSVALFRRSNREKWFYKCVIVLSILWCVLLFPVGLIVGVYLIRAFSSRKSEFQESRKNEAEQGRAHEPTK